MVTVKVGDQNIDFVVDTGAELSEVRKPVAPPSKETTFMQWVRFHTYIGCDVIS